MPDRKIFPEKNEKQTIELKINTPHILYGVLSVFVAEKDVRLPLYRNQTK